MALTIINDGFEVISPKPIDGRLNVGDYDLAEYTRKTEIPNEARHIGMIVYETLGSQTKAYRLDGPLSPSGTWSEFAAGTLAIETVDDLSTVSISLETVIVSDVDRGGIFVYDATQSAVNNGGTIINGWTRQYSGAISIDWFGAVGDGVTDDSAAINSALAANEIVLFTDGIYSLDGGTITIPSYATLQFNGGRIIDGTLTGDYTKIDAGLDYIFGTDITLSGEWSVRELYPQWFGAVADNSTDCSDAFNAAVQNIGICNVIFIPDGIYLTTETIVFDKPSAKMGGVIKSRFGLYGSTIHYTGTDDDAIYLTEGIGGTTIERLTIYASLGDDSFELFNGIRHSGGNEKVISEVTVKGALNGIYLNPPIVESMNFAKLAHIYAEDCINGIVVEPTDPTNSIIILNPHITGCEVGIWAKAGTGGAIGNQIVGENSEIGNNTAHDILIENGQWNISGIIWSEITPIGLEVTSGAIVTIESDVRISAGMIENGGTIFSNANHQSTVTPYHGAIPNDPFLWLSFDEQTGDYAYDRSKNKSKFSFTDVTSTNFNWSKSGYFNTSLKLGASNMACSTLPSDVDLTESWSLLWLGKQSDNDDKMSISCNGAASSIIFQHALNALRVTCGSAATGNQDTHNRGGSYWDYMDWVVVRYDSDTETMMVSNPSCKASWVAFIMPVDMTVLDTITFVNKGLGTTPMEIDEFLMFDRLLSPHETAAIALSQYFTKADIYDSAAPTTGTWAVRDKVYNTAPAGGGATYEGWICTTAGTPGTWKGFGLIET